MHSFAWWPTLAVVVAASITDLMSRRIPNWLVLPFLPGGMIACAFVAGRHGVGQSMLGISLASLVMGLLCWLGGMGLGDLKLTASIGAWIGPSQMLIALVVMAVAGGVIAVVFALRGGFLGESLNGASDLVFGIKQRGFRPHAALVLQNPNTRKIPYAPAIAIGTIFSFFAVS